MAGDGDAQESRSFLLARAQRALGGNSPIEAVRKVRSIIGPREIPDSEAAAQEALKLLQDGQSPSPQQLAALEIVVRLLRPVVLSQGGVLQDLQETANRDLRPQELKDAWSSFRAAAGRYVGSIGRIEDGRNRHVGTGFVVGDGLIATNRHVLAVLSSGSDALAPGASRIVFKGEFASTDAQSDIVPIEGVAKVHPTRDIAIFRAATGGRPSVSFAADVPAAGASVVTIGFPGKDEYNNPLFLTSVFDGRFGVKSAALGELLDGTKASDIFHDCSTTQGNSGSPVFSIETGLVVGIHRSGYFMYRNEAVRSTEIQAVLH
ncbi:trypsin-like serine peptidase [Bradyrhizobium vignae]|uniref:Serine protease n=1 Tax=Bradyrhizobium vignae TaxID=1549949 RepID=A0A2U3PUG3_9BRAD|nr:serine protease [Bradyrhizobium vignae]SPP92800.1 conserved protein of unknown function [Bradyrhizobium vignae]